MVPCLCMEKTQAEKTQSMESEDLKNTIRSTRKNRNNDDDDIDAKRHGTRKKLRLTKEQSTLLEDNFRDHHTLSLFQKQELAHKLGLRPWQVEVWFQNRRARTKLKQIEVDCHVLKWWDESLNNENWRLRRELQEMRFFDKLLKVEAMRPVCQSCDQWIVTVLEEEKGGFFMVGKKKAQGSSSLRLD